MVSTFKFILKVVLLAHGAALLGSGLMGEGRQTGCRTEQVGRALALIRSLAFLQRLLTVGACDFHGALRLLGS